MVVDLVDALDLLGILSGGAALREALDGAAQRDDSAVRRDGDLA